jgi:hypothetical protein
LDEIYFVILNDGQTLVWGGVSLGVLNLTITLYNKLGDSKNAKTVFLEEIHAYKTKTKWWKLEVQ